MMGSLILTGHTAAQITNYTLQLPFHPAAATLTTEVQSDSILELQSLHETSLGPVLTTSRRLLGDSYKLLSWLNLYLMILNTNIISYPAAAAAAKLLQLCPTLCDPRDSSPQGSTVPGILQVRTLEWVAISFSNV